MPNLMRVPESRREAEQTLRVLASGDSSLPRVAAIEQVRPQTLILALKDLTQERPDLNSGRLAVLVDYDALKGTSYVPTLRAYLDSFGDIAAAAARVGVHPNTFRYRVKRLSEISGVDLEDPDERLVTELQLRFL